MLPTLDFKNCSYHTEICSAADKDRNTSAKPPEIRQPVLCLVPWNFSPSLYFKPVQIIFYLSCLSACNFYCIFHSTIPQWAKQYAIKSISHLILNTMGFKPCGALCSSWTRTMCARDVIVGEKIGQRNLLSNLQPDIN